MFYSVAETSFHTLIIINFENRCSAI